MNWLARLKNQNGPDTLPTKPTKPGFVGFVSTPQGHIQKFEAVEAAAGGTAANDPAPDLAGGNSGGAEDAGQPADEPKTFTEQYARTGSAGGAEPDPDRYCWPHSSAMNTGEIDRLGRRLSLFTSRGVRLADAEALADKLVIRDRDDDDRRLCLECVNLSGRRCNAWRLAGIGGPSLMDLAAMPQRCNRFEEATLSN